MQKETTKFVINLGRTLIQANQERRDIRRYALWYRSRFKKPAALSKAPINPFYGAF